jgi:3-hydroxyacyl-[acyl-carrier-protein] dehydratase
VKEKLVLFMGINNAKFRKPVVPGDKLVFKVKLLRQRMGTFSMEAKAFVDDALVAEAELMAAIALTQKTRFLKKMGILRFSKK